MSTIAEMVKAKPDQYDAAIACFVHRDLDREAHTITFHFADGSKLKFKITYTAMEHPDEN